jgi:riboflavin kinase/FMN adenylyltransferase
MITLKGNYQQIHIKDALTLAIGNFDGVHLGHQNIIQKAVSYTDTKSAAMTFSPHPVAFITKQNRRILMDVHDKEGFLSQLGLDYFMVIDFNQEFSQLTPSAFIEFLKKIHVKRIIVGRDFKFGHRGSGSINDLIAHFEVVTLPDYLYQQTRVSTTFIKSLLDIGDLKTVSKLLNKPYSIHGKVVHGDKVGRMMGFPTANIDYGQYYLPKIGIYAVRVKYLGHTYLGCANLGHNPTLNYSSTPRLEVFIMDFEGNLYDEEITIYFDEYLRDEEKFDTMDALLEQIQKDVNRVYTLAKKKQDVLK